MTEEFCSQHSGMKKAIENLENSDKDQWTHINSIEAALPRLVPVWVVIILMVSSALTASALTFAGMIVKFSGQGGA